MKNKKRKYIHPVYPIYNKDKGHYALLLLLPLMVSMVGAHGVKANAADSGVPKVVINIMIDQLRSDYLSAFMPLYSEGGFKKMMAEGSVYTQGEYPHAHVDQANAAATLASGTVPSRHGVVAERWFTAEAWLKDVREYARAQAIKGTSYPGWKIVRGKRPGRHFRDEGEVVNRLAHAGFTEDQYCKPKTLMSPSEMEKSIGKAAFTALLSDYVTQGEGALTLVPEDDKRPEYNNADLQFADLAD